MNSIDLSFYIALTVFQILNLNMTKRKTYLKEKSNMLEQRTLIYVVRKSSC